MISKIFAKGFKSLDFEQPIEQKNLICGPNGAGKSARSDALTLAINGYVPGAGKQNAEILDNFGTGDYLKVGVTISEKTFCREFKRSAKGTVSQTYFFSGHKVGKEEFIGYLERCGKPKILDLSAFLDQSDQKKIDTIFSLFPPDDDLSELDFEISEKKTLKNGLVADQQTAEKSIQRLSRDKAEIELPAGTLAEVTADIKNTETEILTAQMNLETTRIKEASDKAVEAAEEAKKEPPKKMVPRYPDEKMELSPIIDPPSFPGIGTANTPNTSPEAAETISKELPLSQPSPLVMCRKFVYVLENLKPERWLPWARGELKKFEEMPCSKGVFKWTNPLKPEKDINVLFAEKLYK